MSEKDYLIVEMNTSSMDVSKSGKDYILEGIFTEFNTKNNNNRIYEAKDFLPHIEELQKRIKQRKLLGELDHPQNYEVSLKNVSHVIESLKYDEKRNVVVGKIRLMDTDAGRNAKALVDAGVPLHISSRAAGSVNENTNKVKVKKLFTYDLVSEPGFTNAVLERVNESIGFLNESKSVSIYEIKENEKKPSNMNYVKQEYLDSYTRDWKAQFEELKESVSLDNTSDVQDKLETLYETVGNIIKHNDRIVEEVNNLSESKKQSSTIKNIVEHNNDIVDQVNNLEKYLNYLTEQINQRFNHVDHIVEESNKRFEYVDYLAENLDKSIQHSDYLAENLGKTIEYTDYLGENLGKTIEYTDYLGENLDKSIEHSDYLAENLGKAVEYSDYLAENVEKAINYGDYLAENLDKSIAHTDHIIDSLNENSNNFKNNDENVNFLTESAKKDTLSDLDKSLKAILESSKKRKEDNRTKMTFRNQLTIKQQREFDSLNENDQQSVISAFEERGFVDARDAQIIYENVMTGYEEEPIWLREMPRQYKPIWESLTESQKNVFKSQASMRVLDSKESINHFWHTRNLRQFEMPRIDERKSIQLNERVENDEMINSVRSYFNNRKIF